MTEDPGASEKQGVPRTTPARARPALNISQGCLGCGYELMGLPFHGKCPECGKPIEYSLASIPQSDRAAHRIRSGLKYITAGWLALSILIPGCINLNLTLLVCLIGSAFRCTGYLKIRSGYRNSVWEGTGWPGWHALMAGLISLGLLACLILGFGSVINPVSSGLKTAFMVTTMSTLLLVCIEAMGWMYGVRSWAKHTNYPALGPASVVMLVFWMLPSFCTLLLIIFPGSLVAGEAWTKACSTIMLVLITAGAVGNGLIGNLFTDLIHQLEVVPGEMEEDDLAVRLKNARHLRTDKDDRPLTTAESAREKIIPQRGGILRKRKPRKRRHDPPRNPGGTY